MKNTDNLKFGDIVIADLPFSDGSKSKIRPVLVLAKDKNDYLIMKISSIIGESELLDLVLEQDNINNLLEKSVLKIKKIWNFSKEILIKKIWNLSVKHSKDLKNRIKDFVDQM